MKVLFAVGNASLSEKIASLYYSTYGEKIEYKDVFYFKAILEEVKRDKSYDRIVIAEQLEPMQNNVIDEIDKMLFNNIDSITDEIDDSTIIFICSDNRSRNDQLIGRLFNLGIYNVMIGDERQPNYLCKLIKDPRSKKEAKEYLKSNPAVEGSSVQQEEGVNENELLNICRYFDGLKTPDEYLSAFASVKEQYEDKDLIVIVAALTNQLRRGKEIFETLNSDARYTKYCEWNSNYKQTTEKKQDKKGILGFLKNKKGGANSSQELQQVVDNRRKEEEVNPINDYKANPAETIGAAVGGIVGGFKNKEDNSLKDQLDSQRAAQNRFEEESRKKQEQLDKMKQQEEELRRQQELIAKQQEDLLKKQEEEKRLRDEKFREQQEAYKKAQEEMLLKQQEEQLKAQQEALLKQQQEEQLKAQQDALFKQQQEEQLRSQQDALLKQQQEEQLKAQQDALLKQQQEELRRQQEEQLKVQQAELKRQQEEQLRLQQEELKRQQEEQLRLQQEEMKRQQEEKLKAQQDSFKKQQEELLRQQEELRKQREQLNQQYNPYSSGTVGSVGGYEEPETPESAASHIGPVMQVPADYKKVVAIVGTNKVGTSFVTNCVATLLANKGVKTSILDMTKNRGLFWFYEDDIRKRIDDVAICMSNLSSGVPNPVQVGRSKNLTIYTTIPKGKEDNRKGYRHRNVIDAAKRNCNLLLIDCDFETAPEYFEQAQEIYVVQDFDLIKVKETQDFFRELKGRRTDWSKIRVIFNNTVVSKKITAKRIIKDALTFYVDPTETYTDEFEKITRYIEIPMEQANYANYIESIGKGRLDFEQFTPTFKQAMETLSTMVYGVTNNKKKGLF